jgi:hypothetical protein
VSVVYFLGGLRLDGSQRVLGAIAVALAVSVEAAPVCAQARFARELLEIIAQLAEAD